MIIRYTKAEQEELDNIQRQYKSQIDSIVNAMYSGSITSEEADKKIRKLDAERAAQNKAKITEFEDIRFAKISGSPQKIKNNAQTQTVAIIKKLQHTVKQYKPLSAEEREKRSESLEGKTDTELLDMIEPFPDIFYTILPEIESTEGETARLEASQIIDIIKRDLYRHYKKLNAEDRKDLDTFIEQAVNDALEKEPEQALYIMISKDKILSSFVPAVVKKKKLANKRNGKTYINVDGTRYSITDRGTEEMAKHLGLSATMLLVFANAEFTKHSDANRRTVSFPTIPFLELNGVNISNKTSIKTAIDRFRSKELTLLRTMSVRFDKSDDAGLPDLRDQSIIYKTGINKDRITLTFTPEYAASLAKARKKMYFPLSFADSDGRNLNAFAIKLKLWENATIYENVISGQAEIISVWSLLKETNLPTLEELGRKRSLWKERIREPLEKMLDLATSQNNSEFTKWRYCGSKSRALTPQEKKDADRDYYSWTDLYVSYQLSNKEFADRLLEEAKKNKEKKEKAAQAREAREKQKEKKDKKQP